MQSFGNHYMHYVFRGLWKFGLWLSFEKRIEAFSKNILELKKIVSEYVDWCRNPDTNRKLPFALRLCPGKSHLIGLTLVRYRRQKLPMSLLLNIPFLHQPQFLLVRHFSRQLPANLRTRLRVEQFQSLNDAVYKTRASSSVARM